MQIAAEDLEDLSAGAVFLATGGGGDPYVAKLATFNLLTERGPAGMIAVDDLEDDALVVAVGNVGAPTVSLELLPSVQDPARVGGFWIWNASVALTSEDWTVRAYANNIADARGLVSRDPLDALGPRRIALISTPRTFGINLSYRIGGI